MKKRIDVILVERGLFPSRERAKVNIMAGNVIYKDQPVLSAAFQVEEDADIYIKEDKIPFVSRGGLKLEKAIKLWNIDLSDCICMDVGASTGGFTHCMLLEGAKKVYAIDVGYGQLDWKLRQDERVINIEKCNFRYYDDSDLKENIDFASVDVSFISLKYILPNLSSYIKDGGRVVALIKPQFEAGRKDVGKGGIVTDNSVKNRVIQEVFTYAQNAGFSITGLSHSPIKGTKGNVEYIIYLLKSNQMEYNSIDVANVVELGEESFKK